MNKHLKHAPLTFLGFVMIMLMLSSMVLAAEGGPSGTPQAKSVKGYKHQERVAAGTSYQFQFQNQAQTQTQLQLQTNATMDVDMECDADNIGNREFGLQLNTSTNLQLKVKMNASDSSVGLKDGEAVKTQSQNRYRFQHRFMVQMELNKTGEPLQARVSANITDEDATWAYYNEATQEWIPVQSTIQDGQLVAETDHFSIWAVITLDDSSETIEGYSVFGIFAALGIIGVLIIKRKH